MTINLTAGSGLEIFLLKPFQDHMVMPDRFLCFPLPPTPTRILISSAGSNLSCAREMHIDFAEASLGYFARNIWLYDNGTTRSSFSSKRKFVLSPCLCRRNFILGKRKFISGNTIWKSYYHLEIRVNFWFCRFSSTTYMGCTGRKKRAVSLVEDKAEDIVMNPAIKVSRVSRYIHMLSRTDIYTGTN